MIHWKRISIVALITALAGCATPIQKRVETEVAHDQDVAERHMQRLKSGNTPYFTESSEIYLGGELIEAPRMIQLPAVFDGQVILTRQYPVTLQEVVEFIRARVSFPVVLGPAATDFYIPDPFQPEEGQEELISAERREGTLRVNYEGTLEGLLDYVTARTGNYWEYDPREGIRIFRTETRSWQLAVLPGASKLEATVTNQNTSDGGGGEGGGTQTAGGQTTEMRSDIEIFESVAKTVESMLSERGKSNVSEGAGVLTVTDVPPVLAAIGTFVEALNQRMTSQVLIDVQVYSVDLTDTDNYGLDWNLVWQNASPSYGVVHDVLTDLPDNVNNTTITVLDPNDEFAGTQAIVQALSTQGRVSVNLSAPVVTLTNQPVPVQVATETAYLAEARTDLIADVGSTTTLTQEKITTGFTMTLLPVIIDSEEVLLQYQVNLSSLQDLRRIGNDTLAIETPTVDLRNFLQRVRLRNGQTLVVSGFDQKLNRSDQRAVGRPSTWALGGSSQNSQDRTVLVILITPRIMA